MRESNDHLRDLKEIRSIEEGAEIVKRKLSILADFTKAVDEGLYTPTDMNEANAQRGAMCGHGALAAALGKPVLGVMDYFAKPGWVNVPMMKDAIAKAGWKFERLPAAIDCMRGLILLQFTGPWTEPGVPPAAACQYRHWVATRAGMIWDANWPEWMTNEDWKKLAPELLPERSTGWAVWGALRIFHPEEPL